MSESLFSRDYFAKRGSWSVGISKPRSPESIEARKRSSVLITDQAAKQALARQLNSLIHETYIKELLANVRSQKGSREMQQVLKEATPELLEAIVQAVSTCTTEMITDQYANYMCQTLFQMVSSAQRLQLLSHLHGNLLWLAKDLHGTHSVQMLIAMISTPEEDDFFRTELEEHVFELSINPSGTHVIQKLLVSLCDNQFLLCQIVTHAVELATDQLGLCVINKAVSHGQPSHIKSMLIAQLAANGVMLMQHRFGNYVIQHLLDTLGPFQGLVSLLYGKAITLSMQKYSSNVVEKVLKTCDLESKRKIIAELSHKDRLKTVLNSLYGCFVLKTAARFGDENFRQKLIEQIETMKATTTNRKLLQRWQSILAVVT